MQDASDSSGSILFDFADQLLSDLDRGGLQPLAHYLARFPGHEEAVAREYIALTSCIPTPTPGTTRVIERRADRIGPYRLIEILGRGGQGIVYRAEDTRLERTVALKVLSLAVASVSQGRRTRFRREAAILARLQHPGICTILDADLEGDTPYIAMRFVEGETLAVALARSREAEEGSTPTSDGMTPSSASRLLAPRRALDLAQTLSFFERAARTLHAAHEAGVVHRDVKPGNLMVSTDGSPVLLDFGLARGGEDEESVVLTRSDEVFGTPAYISPEQLDSGRHVDRRTDVYSLGVVLYECLTLKRPFQGDSNTALAEAIRFAPIPPPRRANTTLPTDLEVVLETALEKDVARRYPTALDLAEELRRVREYEPIRARPAGPLVRLQRWSRRHPVVAMGTFGSIAALSIALTIALVLLRRVRTEEQRKETALALYEGGWFRDQASGSLPDSPPRSLHYAIAAGERDPGLASNRVLLAALSAMYGQQVLVGHEAFVMQADVDPSSRRIATASLDGTARVWDAHTGQERALFRHEGGTLLCVRFSPDGQRIVVTGSIGRAWIHDLLPGSEAVELVGHSGGVHWAQFSPDGTRVVTASRDCTARVWDARDGRELARLAGHTGSIAEARFLDGGRLVLTRSAEPPQGSTTIVNDATARIFDARSGAELRVLRGHKGAVVAFDASSDGRFVVTASEDRSARLWALDGPGPDPVRVFHAPGRFHAAAFSPDGSRLALSWDAGAKVVDVATGDDLYRLPEHEHRAIVHISWRPDGGELVTIARDDALRVFRASDGAHVRTCRGEVRQIGGLRWSPDGTFLTSWQRRNFVDVWYDANRPFLPVMRGHTDAVRTVVFDPAGERVLTASDDGTARTWRVPTAEPDLVLDPARNGRVRRPLLGAAFDRSGARAATTDVDGNVLVWDAADARLLASYGGGHGTQVRGAFSPDGSRLAFDDGAGAVRIVDLDSGRTRRLLGHERAVTALRFSDDSQRLATGGDDRRVCLWDTTIAHDSDADSTSTTPLWRSEEYAADLAALTSVFDVLIARNGRWVAAACQNVHLEIHDARDGRLLTRELLATPGRLATSRDGSLIMVTSKYGQATTLWRVLEDDNGTRLEQLRLPQAPGAHHRNSTTSLTIASSAPLAVTGSLDRSARLWDLGRQECLASYAGHTDAVYDADLTADGAWIATASGDGTARLWPSDLLAAARRAQPAGYASILDWLPAPARRE
jgi:WD40 repeat protein/serine/threonine protein kinase